MMCIVFSTQIIKSILSVLAHKVIVSGQSLFNFDSQVYSLMTHIGVYLDAGSEQFTVI